MKTKIKSTVTFIALALLALSTLNSQLSTCIAQGTAFTYQARLNSGGSPASGLFDFRFRLDADPAGNTILATLLTNAIPVTNGLFMTTIDFGAGWFNGSNYWLEVDVKTNNFATYTALNPLQQITPAPYAVFASTASNLSGTVSAAQISGAMASANLSGTYANALTLNNAGNSFSGSGANLTSLNADNLGSGTVPLARLPGIVVTNTETGVTLGGTFSGNGGGLTNLNASQLTSIGNTNGSATGNFFVGLSGNSTMSGSYNSAYGYQALNNNTNGNGNTAIGAWALFDNTNGYNNSASGYQALYNNTSGGENTASGGLALHNNTSGSLNSAAGYQALEQNKSGIGNTATGAGALQLNDIGSLNTAEGVGALDALAEGTNNIALGFSAGAAFTLNESSNIDIGNIGNHGDQNIIRIGTPGIQTLTYIAGAIIGNGVGLTNISTSQLTGSGGGNVFVGPAGNSSMNGVENTANGYQAFFSNVSGDFNTADGYQALYSNTGINLGAGGSFNTASGFQSLYANAIGDGNTADGSGALYFNTSGNYNTAIGNSALNNLGAFNTAGGTNNIALGNQAGYNFTGNESSNIDIGNLGVAGENRIIRIGTPGIQTQTYLAGVINGNGGGLTNLNATQVAGSFTNGFAVNGSQSGGFGSPLALIQNNNTSGNTAPALRTVGYGNSPNGVLSISSQGTGLLAQFGNASAFVADITTNGIVDAAGFNGGTLRVGGTGTTMSVIQSGQSQMPGGSSTVETNFTITFPQAFNSAPKILVSVANDPGFQGVNDTFVTSVSSNSVSTFRVNIVRVDSASGWSQHLLINWQAWQ